MDYLKYILILILSMSCVGSGLDYDLADKTQEVLVEPPALVFGSLPGTGGSTIDFSKYSDKPLILIFAQETCSTCIAEAREIIASLRQPSEQPTAIYIVTILAGADSEIAEEWKQDHRIPWSVGYDENLELYERYCPEKQTPCLFVQKPNEGIIFKNVGKTGVTELMRLTGDWY